MLTLEEKKIKAEKIIKKLKELFPDSKIALHYSNPLELLIAVILSAQCTDKMVNKVTENLFKKYKTLDDYIKADREEFEKDIRSTGFYKNKAKNILSAVQRIKEKYHGMVPETMNDLLTLPGVARKTANVVLTSAYGKTEGIVVDTHVRRLSQMFGLTANDDPVKIEQDLMQIIPKKDWGIVSFLLIDYGRAYCTARPHDHSTCPLVNL